MLTVHSERARQLRRVAKQISLTRRDLDRAPVEVAEREVPVRHVSKRLKDIGKELKYLAALLQDGGRGKEPV
jgi:DNA-directed RNA polymerase subunit K/omega